jgi:LysR family transcriptional regulator, glycine cleavage system transcriptional activator
MSRDLPSLNAIRMFEAAAQHLNFTRAAEALHITQGAVSRQIKLLEEQLGQQLFVRDGPRLTLTDTGLEYSRIVQQALEIVRQGTARLRQHDKQARIRISVLPSFAARWLVHRLVDFHHGHPDISVWLSSSYDLVDFNRSDEVDVGIRLGKGGWPGVHSEPLARENMNLVCSPALAADLREPTDLLRHKILSAGPPHDEWTRWFEAAGMKPLTITPTLSRDYSVLLEAAAQGTGVVLARDLLVADDLDRGRLVRPFNLSFESNVQYHFVCPLQRMNELPVRGLLQWLKSSAEATVRSVRPVAMAAQASR